MHIQQLYTNCLAQAAYYIESEGEVAIIDPMRDVNHYFDLLKRSNHKLKYIFETHFHADFVSGHLDLAQETSAKIVFGPGAQPAYPATIAYDDEIFKLGKCKIKVLHTPGHTLESVCYLLLDENEKPYALFSGDTLFVGDVGRPDLLSGNLSAETLASKLFDSLNHKIKPLPDEVILYPGHGPGSACGRNLGNELQSTIGIQKQLNYAMQNISREEFVAAVITDQPAPPPYFFKDAEINKNGYLPLDFIVEKEMRILKAEEIKNYLNPNATVLDVRNPDEFSASHIKGSINIGLNGSFAVWAGTLVDINQPIVLVCPAHKEEETITRLGRIGYENIVGYFTYNIVELIEEGIRVSSFKSITPKEINPILETDKYLIMDVRTLKEHDEIHVAKSVNIPLNQLEHQLKILHHNAHILVYCRSGYRSIVAASILEKNGFNNIVNVKGGIQEILKEKDVRTVSHLLLQ